MGIQGGVRQLQWIFTATFLVTLVIVPLFGWAAKKLPRSVLVPRIYLFVIAVLLIFPILFHSEVSRQWLARAFFIWVSVFNVFIISLFWSFMNDIFHFKQTRRLFGPIAAGGSIGAITGPVLTVFFSRFTEPVNLIFISCIFFTLAVVCVYQLLKLVENCDTLQPQGESHLIQEKAPIITASGATAQKDQDRRQSMGGGILAGAARVFQSPYLTAIAVYIIFYTVLSTILYFEQAHIIKNSIADPLTRTSLFASMDLAVNIFTLFGQLFITSRLVERAGLSLALAAIPLFVAFGFSLLVFFPVLPVLVVFQVLRRIGNYALTKPAREMLFAAVSPEDKYKSKNFIDTVIYRGGDAFSGWFFTALIAIGLTLTTIPFVAIFIALLWSVNGVLLGKKKNDVPEKNFP